MEREPRRRLPGRHVDLEPDPAGQPAVRGPAAVRAVAGAHVVVTDAWYSMGQEAEAEAKRAFEAMMTMSKIDVAAIEAARRA